MSQKNLRDSVERWLIQDNNKFKQVDSPENDFKIIIKHVGSFALPLEIFEPKKQKNVLVLGMKVPLKNNQNARFLQLNEDEKMKFEKKVEDYSNSIQVISKFSDENGVRNVGVYVVLDKDEQINQPFFLDSLRHVEEKSEKIAQYLLKTF